MKSIVTVISWMLLPIAGTLLPTMQDPLLGLAFDPILTHFEAAPGIVLTAERASHGTWYLFAKHEDDVIPNRTYFLVSGMIEIYSDASPAELIGVEPDFGFLAQCDGTTCRVLGVPDRLYDDLGLSPEVVRGIVTDAVARLIRAFGGKARLQSTLDEAASSGREISVPEELARALHDAGIQIRN